MSGDLTGLCLYILLLERTRAYMDPESMPPSKQHLVKKMKVQKCYFVLEGQKLTDYFCYITIVLLRKQEYASNY